MRGEARVDGDVVGGGVLVGVEATDDAEASTVVALVRDFLQAEGERLRERKRVRGDIRVGYGET